MMMNGRMPQNTMPPQGQMPPPQMPPPQQGMGMQQGMQRPQMTDEQRRMMLAQMLASQPAPPQNALGGVQQGMMNAAAMYPMMQR